MKLYGTIRGCSTLCTDLVLPSFLWDSKGSVGHVQCRWAVVSLKSSNVCARRVPDTWQGKIPELAKCAIFFKMEKLQQIWHEHRSRVVLCALKHQSGQAAVCRILSWFGGVRQGCMFEGVCTNMLDLKWIKVEKYCETTFSHTVGCLH